MNFIFKKYNNQGGRNAYCAICDSVTCAWYVNPYFIMFCEYCLSLEVVRKPSQPVFGREAGPEDLFKVLNNFSPKQETIWGDRPEGLLVEYNEEERKIIFSNSNLAKDVKAVIYRGIPFGKARNEL